MPAKALNYYMVELGDHTNSSWSDICGTSTKAVWASVEKAQEKLDGEVDP